MYYVIWRSNINISRIKISLVTPKISKKFPLKYLGYTVLLHLNLFNEIV